ncbi:MAG: AAA family ATPase [Candidatus Hadarchaeum sp.]|uniref:AAA family ATPase n=1 Tax=Candidatus Hadarchaeum sp. TaxID=2883567 RepID=UPI00317B7961
MAALIREIILENFMSHEYSRVPLKSGLNIIVGPNGAGKSSILLGLAVALGQTYTERSRRLGDLVRRGKDLGRVSVVFDNSVREGKRPIASINSDTIVLSRYLSRDGNYWHEINSRASTKGEVMHLLRRLSINPDNMLIIMHQSMIDVFGAIDAKERLKVVEEVVGLKEYRDMILEAREKLSHSLSEEEAIKSLLEKAQETLRYWDGEYQRFRRKQELGSKKLELEIELAWSKFFRQMESVSNLEQRLGELEAELKEVKEDLAKSNRDEQALEKRLKEIDFEIDATYQKLIEQERAHAEAEARGKILESLGKTFQKIRMDFKEVLAGFESDLKRAQRAAQEAVERVKETRSKLVEAKQESERTKESYINARVREAVLGLKRELLEKDISEVQAELRKARRELEEVEAEANKIGPRVETKRKPQEVMDELKATNIQLASLADVSPDVERMYLSYQNTLKELQAKAEIAAANRKRALEELDLRRQKWKSEINKLLREVRVRYMEILKRVNATGDVRLENPDDIDEAGLQLLVGFRGAEPQVLDPHTQSGGERTTAIMCFLLSLQQRIKSPIRAIDEFEMHMDPKNREQMMTEILNSMKDEEAQYIVITPGRLVNVEGVPNVITVQNIAGLSSVKVAA